MGFDVGPACAPSLFFTTHKTSPPSLLVCACTARLRFLCAPLQAATCTQSFNPVLLWPPSPRPPGLAKRFVCRRMRTVPSTSAAPPSLFNRSLLFHTHPSNLLPLCILFPSLTPRPLSVSKQGAGTRGAPCARLPPPAFTPFAPHRRLIYKALFFTPTLFPPPLPPSSGAAADAAANPIYGAVWRAWRRRAAGPFSLFRLPPRQGPLSSHFHSSLVRQTYPPSLPRICARVRCAAFLFFDVWRLCRRSNNDPPPLALL